MQAIYRPSNILDQRTHYETSRQTLNEWEKTHRDVKIVQSEMSKEVTFRIARKRGRPRKYE